MKTLTIYGDNINERLIDEAVEALRNGEIIVYPTDSLYAMGCDALNVRAVERLCRLKGINPTKNRLAIICADLSQASRYVRIDNRTFDILKTRLPGPFTFILPASNALPKTFRGRKEVGLRIPDDPVAIALAERLEGPLMTTTLHLADADHDTMVTASAEIAEEIGQGDNVALMIDSGSKGLTPTTVVNLLDPSNPEIIRQGSAEF